MRCSATVLRTGHQCKKGAITGATVCRSHGGAAPQVALAAKRRTVLAEANAIVAQYDGDFPELTDPAGALLSVVSEYIALKDVLRERANDLTDVAHTTKQGEQQVAAVLQAYLSALDHVSDILVKVNRNPALTEREDKVLASNVQQVNRALRNALGDIEIGLDHETQRAVMAAFAEEIRKVAES
jgi:hypothetical protein